MTPPAAEAQREEPGDGSGVRCPQCGANTTGRYCSECGSSVQGLRCASCQTELAPGAKYCHRCGLPANVAAPPPRSSLSRGQNALPWALTAIVAMSFVALLAGQYFGRNKAASTAASGVTDGIAPAGGGMAGRAPDISSMTPEQQRTALFNRVMRYSESGMQDSLMFFAPMAMVAYQSFGDLDLDGRYELGRIAEVTGDREVAAAQADTMLREAPDHLLALALSARIAKLGNNAGAEKEYYQRFVAADPRERNKDRPEYVGHARDLEQARDEARRVLAR